MFKTPFYEPVDFVVVFRLGGDFHQEGMISSSV